MARPRIGTDEWVAQVEERVERAAGLRGAALATWERLPLGARYAPFVAFAAIFPLLTGSEYKERVALNALLFALLVLGLNVVVGWAGLLDLGYVAFYGFGAYVYAFLSSTKFDTHWPAEATIPIVIASSAVLGFLLGLPSRRLVGDYLAIVTLFFAQIFVVLASNGHRLSLLGFKGPYDLTNGPNGIADVDRLDVFGLELDSVQSIFWFALVATVVVMTALHFLNESRTGRAWRSLRDDPLAAELMGMPVNRLKLLAFVFGAATAGLTGSIFASVQLGVFPGNFDLPLLITIYAMLILGGQGSLPGVVIGAIVVTAVLEALRTPDQARWVFYGAVVLGLVALMRPWWRLAAVLGGTIVLGVVTFAVVHEVRPAWTSGTIEGGGLASLLDGWVVHPEFSTRLGNIGFVVLVAAVLLLVRLHGQARSAFLVPVLYLAAFVWENRLVLEPSVTRILLLGTTLIVLMVARPEGLLGTKRVEIL